MTIEVSGWSGDDTLELTITDLNFNEYIDSLPEEEVVDLTVSLVLSMKDKPAMQTKLLSIISMLMRLGDANG